jgi:hypothetical protein
MGGRKPEGNEQLKRKLARAARRLGKLPSQMQATTGAPQQRKHLAGDKYDHQTRLDARHRNQRG